ncbi:MAG: LysR family transcriptional regulator, partial [Alphaproteobacteria bacterium]|nr:LysR family transcriptional regulator [Alphaproteobacteria bacterium]
QHEAPQTPHDLARHKAILFRLPGGAILPWRFFENGKSFEVTPEGSLMVNAPDMAVRAAVDGVGLLCGSWHYVSDAIADGRLVPLLESWQPPEPDRFFLYYPSRRHVPAPLQALISFLRDNLKNGQNTAS